MVVATLICFDWCAAIPYPQTHLCYFIWMVLKIIILYAAMIAPGLHALNLRMQNISPGRIFSLTFHFQHVIARLSCYAQHGFISGVFVALKRRFYGKSHHNPVTYNSPTMTLSL